MTADSVSGWDFFKFSLSLGLNYYRSGPKRILHREALRRLLTPINVSRCYEFRRTYELLRPQKGDLVFDLSSPKLLSHFLSDKGCCRVITSDMNKQEVADWTTLTSVKRKSPAWVIANGMSLGFKDNIFDKIYSISVLEHIPGEGDTATMQELARVLKPGGRLVITVPYARKFRTERTGKDVYNLHSGKSGIFHWSHFYDEVALRKKLIEGSGLTPAGLYFGYGPGSALWKRIETLGRYGFPFWIFSMLIEKYGLREAINQPASLGDDHFLAAVAVLKKERIE